MYKFILRVFLWIPLLLLAGILLLIANGIKYLTLLPLISITSFLMDGFFKETKELSRGTIFEHLYNDKDL